MWSRLLGAPRPAVTAIALLLVGSSCAFDPSGVGSEDTLVCQPGERVCAGRVLETCSDAGDGFDLAAAETCDFICLDDRCIDASNVPPAEVAGCGPDAPRLAPPVGAEVAISTDGDGPLLACVPHCGSPEVTAIAPRAILDQAVDRLLAWFCLASVDIPAELAVTSQAMTPALAFVVDGEVTIAGEIDLSGAAATQGGPGAGGPGGGRGGLAAADVGGAGQPGLGPCPAEGGGTAGGIGNFGAGGGGGGGGGIPGGRGGSGRSPQDNQDGAGGAGGGGCVGEELVPLVGGTGGASGADGSCGGACGWPGGGGGGALQISARGSITVSGVIRAGGGDGFGQTGSGGAGGGGGGGSGGAVLLEAPALAVPGGAILVEGGAGGVANAGVGGAGAEGEAVTGGEGASGEAASEGGAGGGGGGGRVRLDAGSPLACGRFVSPEASCSSGALGARDP